MIFFHFVTVNQRKNGWSKLHIDAVAHGYMGSTVVEVRGFGQRGTGWCLGWGQGGICKQIGGQRRKRCCTVSCRIGSTKGIERSVPIDLILRGTEACFSFRIRDFSS